MNEIINSNAKPLTKEQFYNLLFDGKAKEILDKEKAKEFYDKTHHQHNIQLIKGTLYFTGRHTFNDFDCSKESRAKRQLDMLRI